MTGKTKAPPRSKRFSGKWYELSLPNGWGNKKFAIERARAIKKSGWLVRIVPISQSKGQILLYAVYKRLPAKTRRK